VRPRGDDEGVGRKRALVGLDLEAVGVAHLGHEAARADLDADCGAFTGEQVDDGAGAAVAEELPELLLVVGDAVLLDEPEKVRRREAGKRRLAEVQAAAGDVML
jgi:hypothetical protein